MPVYFIDPQVSMTDGQFNWDGMDMQQQYQMVPLNGVRRMGAFVTPDEKEDMVIFPADPNKATIWGLYVLKGHASPAGAGFRLKPDTWVRFFITGNAPGPTTLQAETDRGKLRGFLLVSVKRERPASYRLAVLSDAIHIPDFDICSKNLERNMLGAAKIWKDQANIIMNRVGPIMSIKVDADLGDPIYIDEPEIQKKIYDTSIAKGFSGADFFIYATWDIRYRNYEALIGSNTGNSCFVENASTGALGVQCCAHEMGHAFGLAHSFTSGDSLMWPVCSTSNTFIDTWEIEAANVW